MNIINHQILCSGGKNMPSLIIEGSDTNRYAIYGVVYHATKECFKFTKIRICRFVVKDWSTALDRGRDVVKNFHLFQDIFWQTVKLKLVTIP